MPSRHKLDSRLGLLTERTSQMEATSRDTSHQARDGWASGVIYHTQGHGSGARLRIHRCARTASDVAEPPSCGPAPAFVSAQPARRAAAHHQHGQRSDTPLSLPRSHGLGRVVGPPTTVQWAVSRHPPRDGDRGRPLPIVCLAASGRDDRVVLFHGRQSQRRGPESLRRGWSSAGAKQQQ